MKLLYSAVPLSLLLLTGCAARIQSDVTTFHTDVMPAGETIRVVPADPDKIGSLEFQTYASRIGDELRKMGYTPVSETDVVTDLLAEVDYAVEEGQPQIYTDNSDAFVRYHFGFGMYRSPFYFGGRRGFYDPFYYDPFWDAPQVYSEPTYNRTLEMNIVNNDGGDLERVFEGRVESNGTESALPEVMPYLITAMFTNFPGESGKTKLVTIEKDI
jgi:hypothetical protein